MAENIRMVMARETLIADKVRQMNRKPKRQGPSPTGQAIVRLRGERGWSQEELARRAGLARITIARLEVGMRQEGSPETLRRIAAALDVPLAAVAGQSVGVQSIATLLAEFRTSPWAQTMKPPPSDDEITEVAAMGDAVWTRAPATAEAIYHLILALRAADNSTDA